MKDNKNNAKATDVEIVRNLAKRYMEISSKPVQQQRRKLWQQHNSLILTKPLIYVRAFAWKEMPDSRLHCKDDLFRHAEDFFRYHLFWDTLNDDSIFEPWVTAPTVYKCNGWGLGIDRTHSDEPAGSFKIDYPIKELDDIEKIRMPWHEIDEEATAKNAQRLGDAIGDIITINVDRGPAYRMWSGDISTELGHLRGMENFMLDMMDNEQWLHRLLGFMRDGILAAHEQAEAAGDWGLSCHQNQAMPYARELPSPAANQNGIKRSQLWCYMAAQEFVLISPQMHNDFMLEYQLPILKHFGLTAYGCCEDLTKKIDMVRRIPNLRRIAVSPFADVAKCAEQIAEDYVISYRPSPADMVSYGLSEQRIEQILKRDIEACHGLYVDITLKDVETVESDPTRVAKWVQIVRRVVDKCWK
jgi:hypothetical protein